MDEATTCADAAVARLLFGFASPDAAARHLAECFARHRATTEADGSAGPPASATRGTAPPAIDFALRCCLFLEPTDSVASAALELPSPPAMPYVGDVGEPTYEQAYLAIVSVSTPALSNDAASGESQKTDAAVRRLLLSLCSPLHRADLLAPRCARAANP